MSYLVQNVLLVAKIDFQETWQSILSHFLRIWGMSSRETVIQGQLTTLFKGAWRCRKYVCFRKWCWNGIRNGAIWSWWCRWATFERFKSRCWPKPPWNLQVSLSAVFFKLCSILNNFSTCENLSCHKRLWKRIKYSCCFLGSVLIGKILLLLFTLFAIPIWDLVSDYLAAWKHWK